MKIIKIILWLALTTALIAGCKSNAEQPPLNAAPEVLSAVASVKIKISEEGIYRLTLADLGWDSTVIENLALTHRGQPIPIQIENNGEGVSLFFYGQPSDSSYTPENIYILQHLSKGISFL